MKGGNKLTPIHLHALQSLEKATFKAWRWSMKSTNHHFPINLGVLSLSLSLSLSFRGDRGECWPFQIPIPSLPSLSRALFISLSVLQKKNRGMCERNKSLIRNQKQFIFSLAQLTGWQVDRLTFTHFFLDYLKLIISCEYNSSYLLHDSWKIAKLHSTSSKCEPNTYIVGSINNHE
jgi:hypothetical protein